MKRSAALSLLATLFLGDVALADDGNYTAAANYTEYLLSSGTVKLGDWEPAYEKAAALVATLTTAEKISIISGADVGNFSALATKDSSTNPLTYAFVTTWPAGLAMAMTWNKTAMHDQGQSLGQEFRGKGVNMAYAPTQQPLGRSAWNGRQGETYGVDPYMSGAMSAQFVAGMNEAGVISSAKHWIMNEFETNRQGTTSGGGGGGPGGGGGGGGGGFPGGGPGNSTFRRAETNSTASGSDSDLAYSVYISDKAFHETYLAPFYPSVKAGLGAMMCAMNRVNGTYSCESQDLLGKYLKVELGFPGQVNADVGGQHTSVNSANAGMDYSGSEFTDSTIQAAVNNGSMTMDRLDDMVIRNAIGYYKLEQDRGYPQLAGAYDKVDNRGNHASLARSYAADSLVLLKNVNNALPLSNLSYVSIFGYHAGPRYVGPTSGLNVFGGLDPTERGHMAFVGGSAMASMAYQTTPFQLFNERAAKDGFMLKWWMNDSTAATTSGSSRMMGGSGTEITETAVGVTDHADACVVFLNAQGGEGADRVELRNATADDLVTSVADNCDNTIVVINTIGPRLVDAWVEHENVTAVLYGGALGQESGNAIDDVLFGAVNPSGKLVHTIARNESDYNPDTRVSQTNRELYFDDGNYIDYRYFDRYNVTPRYEFGFGLSYTTFNYSETATATKTSNLTSGYANGTRAVGGREDLWDVVAQVSSRISNTGSTGGQEVAQLYVSFPAAADEPVRQLRGFEKVAIQPGGSEAVTFELVRRDLSVWDTTAQEWKVESGEYTFWVGSSSRDLKAKATLNV